jgi:hypothetical protein
MNAKNRIAVAITLVLFSSLGFARQDINRNFMQAGYACYIDSLEALEGAVSLLKRDSNSWCNNIGGHISRNSDLEVKVYNNESPLTGGCPGDVTVKAEFSCSIQSESPVLCGPVESSYMQKCCVDNSCWFE